MTTLALVGAGRWGKNYIRTIEKQKDITLKYICTTSKKNIQNLPKKYTFVTDYRELITHSDIDGIIIATPAATHFSIANFFIGHNKNILIEKPFVVLESDAKKLETLYRKRKGIVMTGYIYLYNTAFEKMLSLRESLGKIQYIYSEGCSFGPARKDTDALWDWGPHDIAMCMAIMKHEPLSVSASAVYSNSKKDTIAMCFMKLQFKNNIQAIIKVGWLWPLKKRNMTVVGNNASLIFDDLARNKVKMIKNNESNEPIVEFYTYNKIAPLENQIRAFVRMIKKSERNESDFSMSVKITKILSLLEKSIQQNGKEISV